LIGSVRLLCVIAAHVAVVTGCGADSASDHPHVVLVIVDTLRADRLGSYGFERETSPELDALAARGTRFAHAISQSPWTRPSIGSMLTSLYPRSIGIYHEETGILNDRFQTLAEILRDQGYRTYGATANPHLNRAFNFQQGFDEYLDSTSVWHWMDAGDGYSPAASPALASARQMFEAVLGWLERENDREARSPHYLQFNLMEVHETWGEHDLVRPEFKSEFSEFTYEKHRRYLQAIRQVSHDLNWLVDTLAKRPGWDDVVYVVVSDHGEGLDSHPSLPESDFHGTLLYESNLRVPLILFSSGPRVPQGLVIERPVRLLEVVPTVLELAGISPPQKTQGRSLVPLLRGTGEVDLPAAFVVETEYWDSNKIGAYTNEWKMILNLDNQRGSMRQELQRIGVEENGRRTDLGQKHFDVLQELLQYIRHWQSQNPRVPSTLPDRDLPKEVVDQLRELGYVH
jgi:arylsulfatase A-like enzyme